MKRFIFTFILAFVVGFLSLVVLSAQEPSQSAAPAATVKALLEQLKMETIATRDPDQPGRYIAALYIQDSQLLVVSAPYSVPPAMDKLIATGDYMAAYQHLQAVTDHRGHFFVVDLLADGLKRVPAIDQPFDSTTTDGDISVAFDGRWDAQKLTEAGYNAMFAKDDARYARILTILENELKK